MKKLILSGTFALLLVTGTLSARNTSASGSFEQKQNGPVQSSGKSSYGNEFYNPLNNPWNVYWWEHDWHYMLNRV